MKPMKISKDLYWLGTLDPDLRMFDIVVETKYGTSYNAYLLKGSEKNALFETTKPKFWEEYLESIEKYVGIENIDYLVMNHTEPDHSGCVEKLLELNPKITVVGTAGAMGFLKEILNKEFNHLVVKEGDTLSLGDKTLRFMPLPNLHWPDTMFTYVEEGQLLFTCDAFGCHYCHDQVLMSKLENKEDYQDAVDTYFNNIIAPFKHPFVTNALKKVQGLPIKMICTGHGPVLDSDIEEVVADYHRRCELPEESAKKRVVIPYVSAYGYTEELAKAIGKGIENSREIEVLLYNLENSYVPEVIDKLAMADGVLFGTPTMVGEALPPILSLMATMHAITYKGKLASAFGSYGWSGEGVPHVLERLSQLKCKVIEGYKIRFKASEEELKEAYEYGVKFGEILLGEVSA